MCTLVRFRTPSYIRVVPVGSTVDEEKKEEMEIRRERGRKGVREEGDRKRDKESTKSRERDYCSLHLEVRGCFKEGRFKKQIIIFSASISNLL